MKRIILTATVLTSISFGALAQQKVGFPKYMYSKDGCSKTYFEKARKLNKIMGFSLGGAGLIASSFMPFSALFVIGGLGSAAETGYTYIEESEDKNKKIMAPRVRYPLARQYFDITNTLELTKIVHNSDSGDLSDIIPMYFDSLTNSKKAKSQYKECKSLARLEGISRGELKQIEQKLTEFLIEIEKSSADGGLSPIETAKKSYANCLLEIEVDDTYPIADLLLLKNELETTNLLSWRFKSSIRLFKYIAKKAKQQNKNLDAATFFKIIKDLDADGQICSNTKRPLNRKNLAKEVILKLE